MASGELVGAMVFALGAGVATFFSPCAYALLPGYVGYYVAATGEESPPLSGTLVRGFAAAFGAIAVLSALSLAALVAGEAVGRVLPLLEVGVGIALIGLGIWVLYGGSGAVHVLLPERRSTVLGFGLFGAMYALAATACVLPLFLALALRSLTMPPLETALVLGTYAIGFGVLTVAVTVATAFGYALGAGRLAGYVDRVVRVAGAVLVVAGVGQLYVALG
ncbi:cytochrome c biogenesis protein CcdA [Natrinema sp. 1APR25-10V2]|uniref:cytochrome c biogenesis CcdA family protein n=1 Tax=Natrinema sp. 1APR25-10V2 TaxID=2951081 RepID=UPI0028750AE8|nr:cytochrome c biogenesis protein CcdA [Natrinema sp. 1APR25-10V2]MDS0477452.1 cytochrome C biogenesis protein [Natrinema sp. 1APR25-10V2]